MSCDGQRSWEEGRGTTKENHGGQSTRTETNLRQRRRGKLVEFPLLFKSFRGGELDFRIRIEIWNGGFRCCRDHAVRSTRLRMLTTGLHRTRRHTSISVHRLSMSATGSIDVRAHTNHISGAVRLENVVWDTSPGTQNPHGIHHVPRQPFKETSFTDT